MNGIVSLIVLLMFSFSGLAMGGDVLMSNDQGPNGMNGNGMMQQRPGMGRTPPEQAIKACSGQSNQAACQLQTPDGRTIRGSCMNTPDGKYFACIPDHPPIGQDRGQGMMGQGMRG